MRALRVLILASKQCLRKNSKIIGIAPDSIFFNKEVENYIELLTCMNVAHDIKYHNQLSSNEIIDEHKVKYSSIIVAVPGNELSDATSRLLQKVSYDHGVSIVASYDRINGITQELFGIKCCRGKRICYPLTLSVIENNNLNIDKNSKIKIVERVKGLLPWSIKLHRLRYLIKLVKLILFKGSPYLKVETSPGTKKIAVFSKKNTPAILSCKYGKATNYYICVHSDIMLANHNNFHKIFSGFIVQNSGWGMVRFNLEKSMVLRMDDPGTCERVYLKGYDSEILKRTDFEEIVSVLQTHKAKMSVMYVPVWVDDGNLENGQLALNGKSVKRRIKGARYESKNVVFHKKSDNQNTKIYDYVSEFEGLKESISTGLIDIESHGLTHVDTLLEKWLEAKDRYTNPKWYHEFRHMNEDRDCTDFEHIDILQNSAKKIEKYFGITPSTITPSGHMQSRNSDVLALTNGYKLFSSDYTSLKKNGVVLRNSKLRSVFLSGTKPIGFLVNSGYPVIGVFHDYDIANNGADWLNQIIKDWKEIGIKKFMTARELAGYLGATINARQSLNSICIEVSISKTGGVSGKKESRYFYDNIMVIEIILPEKTKLKSVFIENRIWEDYTLYQSKGLVELNLPPFKNKDRQRVDINIEKAIV